MAIRASIEGKPFIYSVNVSQQFRILIAFGFWMQFINFVTEIAQQFIKKDEANEDHDDGFIRDYQEGDKIEGLLGENEGDERSKKIKIMKKAMTVVRTITIIMSVVFVVLLLNWRGSHGGEVCSGKFLTDYQLLDKNITQYYEIGKGQFLKVVMFYYYMVILGIACLITYSFYQKYADRDTVK